MTKGLGVREYRACTRCRTRKTRCDLQSVGEPGRPPCAKCLREGAECVLAGSRRGGNFSRFRRSTKPVVSDTPSTSRRHDASLSATSADHVSPRQSKHGEEAIRDSLQNPSDALLILAHAAGQPDGQVRHEERVERNSTHPGRQPPAPSRTRVGGKKAVSDTSSSSDIDNLAAYPLVHDGTINPALIPQLLSQYAEKYHPFFPIVPAHVLDPDGIRTTIKDESFLVTAILAIASKDRGDLVSLNKAIWDHMRKRILDVVLGVASIRKVGVVEGLLVLGEWTLVSQRQTDDGGEGAAWSIIGLAVRLAYLLRLEESSFRGSADDENEPGIQRQRLAWTFIYLSDRQVSIRMGQAFWCRGPALSARFTAQDFPSLQPSRTSQEDFASWIQAQVELTTLFGNAHDILFASRARTAELMTRGDYTKYVDDTSRAMEAWQRAWQSISVSPHIRSCLTLMQEYLRLYVNAFAFQAVLYRASLANEGPGPHPVVYFPDSTMASPDARHVYEAIDAAESLLRIVTEDFDAERHLRYMPDRFYLYEIHSSVFLYKARAAGAISPGKHAQMTALIQRFITVLTTAAVDDSHIASRYGKLLHRLWFYDQHQHHQHQHQHQHHHSQGQHQQQSGDMQGQPANTHAAPSDALQLSLLTTDVNGSQLPMFDDLGLQPFDCTDTMDGLFAMPPVFPWDQPAFLGVGGSN